MWLPYSVAQGSVLGPRFFNIYTKSLYKYVEPTRFKIEGFADDHQLIKRFLPSLQSHALGDNIQYCLNMISQWMNDHFLCLNQDKTKILVIAPPCVKKEIIIGGMFLDDHCIRFVDSEKKRNYSLFQTLIVVNLSIPSASSIGKYSSFCSCHLNILSLCNLTV